MPRCLPILTPFFNRFFIDFYLQLRSPEPSKSLFFRRKNEVFSKNRSSKLASIFARFWCQRASILLPKIHQNPCKNRFQDASFFRSIFASIFRFCFDLGCQLGAMLATFSLKTRRRWMRRGWFFLGLLFLWAFWASWPPLGALWARFGKVRASILKVFGAHFLHHFQSFCTNFFTNLSPMLKHLLH